jgi:hypothetical protein
MYTVYSVYCTVHLQSTLPYTFVWILTIKKHRVPVLCPENTRAIKWSSFCQLSQEHVLFSQHVLHTRCATLISGKVEYHGLQWLEAFDSQKWKWNHVCFQQLLFHLLNPHCYVIGRRSSGSKHVASTPHLYKRQEICKK